MREWRGLMAQEGAMGEDARVERGFQVHGRVQGVGFRWWTVERAREAGVTGWVWNRPDGSVEVQVAGDEDAVEGFGRQLREGPPAARVTRVEEVRAREPARETGFRVR